MNFPEFAHKLYPLIGNGENTSKFTKTLFESILGDENIDYLPKTSPNTYKAYYNGQTSITKISQKISSFVEDGGCFTEYLENLPSADTVAQSLSDAFSDTLPKAGAATVFTDLGMLFAQIIKEAAASKRNTTAPDTENNCVEAEVLDEPNHSSANHTGTTIIQKQVNIENNTVNNFNIENSNITFNL